MATPLNNSNTKSETFCSHYERDTCVMHFRCCPEDKWYPCHKCHNEAVEKEHDKTKDLTVAHDTPRGVSTIPTEGSSSEAEENSDPEGFQVREEERTRENLAAENPNDPESNEVTGTGELAAGGNGHVAAGGSHEESDSLILKDPSPSSPAESKTIHSVALVTDASQLRSTACGQEQGQKKLVAAISVDPVPKDERESENLAADFNGHNAVETHELQNLVAEDETGSGNVAADGNGHVAGETHKESDSLVSKDPSPSSPAKPKTIHSVASATDATQLRCTGCGQEQEPKELATAISVDTVPKDERGSENLAADFNGHNAVDTHEESVLLVAKEVASANDAEQLRQCTAREQEQELQNLVAEDETGPGNLATDGNAHVAEETHCESDSLVPNDSLPSSPAEPKTIHLVASATDATQLKCTACEQKQQEFSDKCQSCDKSFAQYFCNTCKLLIEKNVDAYHCDKCGICRGNKADHFHCDVCNVCMSQSLKDNHKCFSDRGHDPCAICYEEVFSGAIILPCFHMIHKECAERLLLSGSQTCPMCRYEIFQNGEDRMPAEDPGEDESQQNRPSLRSRIGAACTSTKAFFVKLLCKSINNGWMPRNTSSNQGIGLYNVLGLLE